MPAFQAKVVTIISRDEVRETILEAFKAFGVNGFSYDSIKGQGPHGQRHGGLFEGENVIFTVVTTEAIATRVLKWAEEDLLPVFHAVVYVTDAAALIG